MIGLGKLGCLGRLGKVTSGNGGAVEQTAYASGRAFPVWNTTDGDNKLLSLSLHGLTEQNAIPTPQSPVPLQSVGNDGLLLSVMTDRSGGTYQLLDIRAAMINAGHDGLLRSVNGIYDEIIYNGKTWKLIKRIQNEQITICTGVSNHVGDTDCYFNVKDTPVNGSVSNGLLCTHFIQGNIGVNTININSNPPYLGIFRYPNNGETLTEEYINNWLSNNNVYVDYQLATPIEYNLNLPVISTYEGQTNFATNPATVKPRMTAECKVSTPLDYIKDGLIGYWSARGRSNADVNKTILPDLSGNGNDLTHYNMAYTPTSGYGDGYIQYDGIDDFSVKKDWTNNQAKSLQITLSNVIKNKNNFNSFALGTDRRSITSSGGKGTFLGNYNWINGVRSNFDLVAIGQDISCVAINMLQSFELMDGSSMCLGSFWVYNNGTTFCNRLQVYDALVYGRSLSDSELLHNYKVSQQFNGDNFDGYTI